MIIKILKGLLTGLLIILLLLILWLVLPGTWSALNPGKPPVGYYSVPVAYLASWVGLEKLVDLEPEIPENIEVINDIEYKNIGGKSLQLDIYRPKNRTDQLPLLVFIHGGSWRGGKRSDYQVYLVDFAEKGYITATISYRLLRDGPYPACIEDVTDAVDWFYRNYEAYGYDTSRIALVGGSAGAHLALLAAYGWRPDSMSGYSKVTHHNVKAVVDIYGPVDFTDDYARNHPTVTSFLAHTFEEAPEIFKEASPVHYLDKDDPPTMILQGTADRLVPAEQSDRFKVKLDSTGIPCVYHRLPGWPHTMDVVRRVNDYCQLKMTEFFRQYLN
ncbi:MAG: alpha/beta hydrolase [Bacteroidales bacterium]|nr:alpha/beta hydrolase [Bacteroidales bacterium]